MTMDKLYEQVAVDCFRFFNFRSFDEVDALSMAEYEILMKAYKLKQIDKLYYIHRTAYENQRAKATKKQGKNFVSVYKSFKDFFDYEKELKEAEKITNNKETNKGIDVSSVIEYKRRKLKEQQRT